LREPASLTSQLLGTELPIRNVRSSVAIGGKAKTMLTVSSSHL
jgi:hypothetical protein